LTPTITISTGKGKIVSLILPDVATSIKAGDFSNPTFKKFYALKTVTGGTVTSVGEWAFARCNALETMSLPAATSIGNYAQENRPYLGEDYRKRVYPLHQIYPG
jgi:hypothetical protein